MNTKGFALDTRSHPTALSVKEKTEHPFRFAYIGGFAPDTPNNLTNYSGRTVLPLTRENGSPQSKCRPSPRDDDNFKKHPQIGRKPLQIGAPASYLYVSS